MTRGRGSFYPGLGLDARAFGQVPVPAPCGVPAALRLANRAGTGTCPYDCLTVEMFMPWWICRLEGGASVYNEADRMGPIENEFNAGEYPVEYVVVGVSDGMPSILERIEDVWTRTPNAVLI